MAPTHFLWIAGRMRLLGSATLLAIFLGTGSVLAKPYTPAAFESALLDKIGTKKNLSAANAAAAFLGEVLRDKQNTKRAPLYIAKALKVLGSVVRDSLQGTSRCALAKQLTAGCFAKVKPDPYDPIFLAALKKLLSYKMPATQKTTAVSSLIIEPVYIYFERIHGWILEPHYPYTPPPPVS